MNSSSDPGHIFAHLPAIFGFYPRNSLIIAQFYAIDEVSQPGRLRLGPVLRVDIEDVGELEKIQREYSVEQSDLIMAFIVSEDEALHKPIAFYSKAPALERLVALVEKFAETADSHLAGCWITTEIFTGNSYRSAYPTIQAGWDDGVIANVATTSSMASWVEEGLLPEANREDLMYYLNGPNSSLALSYCDYLDDQAAKIAQELSLKPEHACSHTIFLEPLMQAPELSFADLAYENENESAEIASCHCENSIESASERDAYSAENPSSMIVNTVANIFASADNSGVSTEYIMGDAKILFQCGVALDQQKWRDCLVADVLRHPRGASAVLLAAARTFTGVRQANALSLYAIAQSALGFPMLANAALCKAIEMNPHHRLSRLLLHLLRIERRTLLAITVLEGSIAARTIESIPTDPAISADSRAWLKSQGIEDYDEEADNAA